MAEGAETYACPWSVTAFCHEASFLEAHDPPPPSTPISPQTLLEALCHKNLKELIILGKVNGE